MKIFEVGDKVSFLNAKLDGVISKVLPNGNYSVELDDGFEMEAAASELVKIAIFQKDKFTPSSDIETKTVEQLKTIEEVPLRKILPGLSDCVTLVLMPSNPNQVLTGAVKYFLVNESKYDVLYSFSYKQTRKLIGISSGKLEPASELFIGELTRDVLMESESLYLQLIFHQKNYYLQIPVLTKELSIEYPDLNHVNKNINGAAAFSKTATLISFAETPEEDLSEMVRKFQSDQSVSFSKRDTFQNSINKSKEHYQNFNLAPGLMEVDLHI